MSQRLLLADCVISPCQIVRPLSQQSGCARRRIEGPQRVAEVRLQWPLPSAFQVEAVSDRQRRMVGELLYFVD